MNTEQVVVAAIFGVVAAVGMPVKSSAGTLEEAYAACTSVIRGALVPTGSRAQISFDAQAKRNWSRGDEFYFSWQSGFIRGAKRTRPDSITGSMKPSASCIGSLSGRKISSASVNGADVVSSPRAF